MAERDEPVIRVDFQNADAEGRVRLNTRGSFEDIAGLEQPLFEGQLVRLVDQELAARGMATFSSDERIWIAVVDWAQVIPSED